MALWRAFRPTLRLIVENLTHYTFSPTIVSNCRRRQPHSPVRRTIDLEHRKSQPNCPVWPTLGSIVGNLCLNIHSPTLVRERIDALLSCKSKSESPRLRIILAYNFPRKIWSLKARSSQRRRPKLGHCRLVPPHIAVCAAPTAQP